MLSPPKSLAGFGISLGVAMVGALVLADELHHVTESLLSVIAH